MSELWGFQAGQQQAQQYNQDQALFNLQMQEGGLKLKDDAVLEQTHELALKQQLGMLALQQKRAAAQSAKQSSASGGATQLPGTGAPIDETADATEQASLDAYSVGNVEQGAALAEKSSLMREHDSTIRKNDAEQRVSDLTIVDNIHRAAKPQLDAIDAQEANGALDAQAADKARQQIWRDGNMQFMSTVGRPSPVAGQPYSRELFDAIGNETQNNLQRAQEDAAVARQKAADAQAKKAPLEEADLKARIKETNLRIAALEKNGGITDPKAPEDYEWKLDPKTGKPMLDEDGQRIMKPVKGGPKDPDAETAGGGGMFGGAYGKRFAQRVIGAATEGQAQLQTIARLGSTTGVPTQGIFKGNIIGSGKTGSVAQLLTSARQKEYNASLSGLAPELAAAQNQGLAPTEAQINNTIQNLSIYPTDDAQTAQFKVALLARDFRKALEGGLDNMDPKQAAHAREIISQLEIYPDPDTIANAKPGENMFPPGKFGAKGVQPVGGAAAAPTSGWGQAKVVNP